MKIAGRDAGKTCVIVDIIDKNLVLIDGQTRRRKCSIAHLEPLSKEIKIKKGASHAEIVKEFSKLKMEIKDTKPKKATERPRQQRAGDKKGKISSENPAEKPVKKAETQKKSITKK